MKRSLPDMGRKGWLPSERKALFAAAVALGPVQGAALRWAYETASRASEVVATDWKAIRLVDHTVSIDRLKRSLPCVVRFSEEMGTMLVGIRAKQEGLVFGDVSRHWLYQVFLNAGLKAGLHRGLCHPHAAKHTRMYDLSAALRKKGLGFEAILKRLQLVSGHAKRENLLIYLEPIERAKEIADDLSAGLEDL